MKRKRLLGWLLLLVLLIVAMVGLWFQRGATVTPSLFADLPATEVSSSFPKQAIAKRHRWVRFDRLGISQLALKPGEEKRVVLNLFPDLEVEATIMANKTHWNKDQSAFGLIENNPNSFLVMSRHKGTMMGVVALPDGRQVLINHVKDGKYVIIEVDANKLGGCGNCAKMARGNSGRTVNQGKAAPASGKASSSNGGVKTSATPGSTWTRRLAMANNGAIKETEEVPTQCGDCKPGNPGARMQPMLAALGAPPAMLAAAAKGIGGHGVMSQASRGTTKFQRVGGTEYIDVLFLYSADLYTQEGGNAQALINMQTEITAILDTQNAIFTQCGIPLEVRQAGALTAARSRVVDRSNVPPGYQPNAVPNLWSAAGNEIKPAWKSVQPPERQNTLDPDLKKHTIWNPALGIGQKQAKVGIYEPLYADITNAPVQDLVGYLDWILDRKNSLLYGDQHWGTAQHHDGSNQPFINLPEGFVWRLTPPDVTLLTTGNNWIYSSNDNKSILTGPVDHNESTHSFYGKVEAASPDSTHDLVQRYEYDVTDTVPSTGLPGDANGTIFGTVYNPNYSGVLGIRMDLNGTDYSSTPFIGDLNATNALKPGPRYPVLHTQEGNFTDATINSGGAPNRVDVRADLVCVLVDDALPDWAAGGLGTTNWDGIADKYTNQAPNNDQGQLDLGYGLGRGPFPISNNVQQSSFATHAGQLMAGSGTDNYSRIFTTADLKVTGVVNNNNATGLVAFYAFDGNTNDGSPVITPVPGNLNAGATFGIDRHGSAAKALELSGAGDNVTVSDNANNNISGLGQISMGGWVMWNNLAGTGIILNKPGEFNLESPAGGTLLRVQLTDAGSNIATVSASYNFAINQWYHVFTTYDGKDQSGVKLFVNGFEVPSAIVGSLTGSINDSANALTIGSQMIGAGAKSFVDEVRIYDNALSANEVLNLYLAERPVTTTFDPTLGLVAHYTFESSGSLADSSPQGNTATGAGTAGPALTDDRYGVLGNAYHLNPTGTGTINTGESGFPSQYGNFTLSFWLNNVTATGFGSGRRTIVANQRNPGIELTVDSSNGRLGFNAGVPYGLSGGGFNSPKHESPPLTWVGNTWHHVVIKYEGYGTVIPPEGNCTIYRDGVKLGSSGPIQGLSNQVLPGQRFFTFGDSPARSDATDDLNGSIDEVRLYTRAISDTEVRELYVLEKPVMPTLIMDSAAGLSAHYPCMAEAVLNDVTDITGTNAAGLAFLASQADGRYGPTDPQGSYNFIGAAGNDHLNLNRHNPPLGNGAFTISFWTNPNSLPAGSNTMDLLGNHIINNIGTPVTPIAGPTNNTDSWWVDMNSTGHVVFHAANSGGPSTAESNRTNPLSPGLWKQVIITRNSSRQVQIYIDGTTKPPGPLVSVPIDINGTANELWAGSTTYDSGSQGFNLYDGKLDEIRIYPGRFFAAWEVDELFKEENPVQTSGSASISFKLGKKDNNGPGESLRLGLFSNNLTDPTFVTQDFNNTGDFVTHQFSGSHWQNLRGAFRLTSQAGTALIESMDITVNKGPLIYQGTIIPPNTPSTVDLFKNVELNRDRTFGMVCRYQRALTNWTFAHELGHLLGGHHGLGDGGLVDTDTQITFNPYGKSSIATIRGLNHTTLTSNVPQPTDVTYTVGVGSPGSSVRDSYLSMGNHFLAFATTSFGTASPGAFGRFCTIMAYDKPPGATTSFYQRIPRYTSPGVLWNGTVTGDNHGRMLPPPFGFYVQPMFYDHVKALSTIGPVIGFFRDENGSGRQDPSFVGPFYTNVTVWPDPGTGPAVKKKATPKMAKLPKPSVRGNSDGSSSTAGRGLVPGLVPSTTGSTRPTPTSSGGKAQSGKGLGSSVPTIPGMTPSPKATKSQPTPKPSPKATKNQPASKSPQTPIPPTPTTTKPKQTSPPVKGSVGKVVPNDSRQRSQPMALRLLVNRSYHGTISGHNLGATGGEDASLRTDDARPAFHGQSVWWHAVVVADGSYELQVDTRGSAIDTTLAVWLPGADTPLANDNDPRRPGPASAVRVGRIMLRKGQRILMAVDGVNKSQGQVRLNLSLRQLRRRR